jgi:hypothetical protein
MANIPVQQAKALFTKAYMAAYKERVPAPSFLMSFFTVLTFATKMIGIEVQRGSEIIAVDVERGATGNRNQFTKSTEKQWIPPFFDEWFDATSLDRYDVVFGGAENVAPETIGYLASDTADKLMMLKDKIDRAKELQCAQIFSTGVITLKNGDSIDFKRQSTSMVDLGDYWSTTTTDVESQLIAGAQFIRQKGKNGTSEFNLVMSGAALVALKKTDYFQKNANYQNIQLIDIRMPQTQAFGAGYHGRITAGAYIFNIWTYDEVYEAAGTKTITRYLAENKAFMVPVKGTRFNMSHAGVPAIMADQGRAEFPQYIAQLAADYYVNNYIDPFRKAHIFEILSAPLGIPVTVDMIYTMQVLGAGGEQG